MKLIIKEEYFGNSKFFIDFINGCLEEMEGIEERGKKNSSQPERFFSDCYRNLHSLQIIFEDFKKKIENVNKEITFETGEGVAE